MLFRLLFRFGEQNVTSMDQIFGEQHLPEPPERVYCRTCSSEAASKGRTRLL